MRTLCSMLQRKEGPRDDVPIRSRSVPPDPEGKSAIKRCNAWRRTLCRFRFPCLPHQHKVRMSWSGCQVCQLETRRTARATASIIKIPKQKTIASKATASASPVLVFLPAGFVNRIASDHGLRAGQRGTDQWFGHLRQLLAVVSPAARMHDEASLTINRVCAHARLQDVILFQHVYLTFAICFVEAVRDAAIDSNINLAKPTRVA